MSHDPDTPTPAPSLAAREGRETESTIPRRIRRDLWSPGERAIQAATDEVEEMGADVRLTDAVILLGKARDAVADYVDGVPRKEPEAAPPSGEASGEASEDTALVEKVRVAMRAAGPHYHLVLAASERAAKAGRRETAERLEYVYGRLYWMDHALGTMRERVENADRAEAPTPEASNG